ncbi:MAG: RHS repeat-associated core domain-containing protein, partial [Alcanivoracaceae bacterium]|nr:RHS repeat-associated core domain-containing protein [Alcanivoracaceae bacterium]
MNKLLSQLIATPASTISPTISLGSKYRKVNIMGIPVGEPSPTGKNESDSGHMNQFHVDMYALSLQSSFVDINLPCEGGELSLQFVRSFSTSRVDINGSSKVGVLGMGWHANINATITCIEENGTTIAHATDENGAQYTFFESIKGLGFTPLFTNPSANASRKVKFNKTDQNITLGKWQKTQLNYTKFSQEVQDGKITKQYKLTSIIDRNGNAIIYTYSNNVKFLVTSIHEQAHPERKINFKYRSLGLNPDKFDCGFRLTSIVDPLGRSIKFNYSSRLSTPTRIKSLLSRVISPATTIAGKLKSAIYSYRYRCETIINPQNQQQEFLIALNRVKMPNDYNLNFKYSIEKFPHFIDRSSIIKIPELILRKIMTANGHCDFNNDVREISQVKTQVINSDGINNSYLFKGVKVNIEEQPIAAIFIHKLSRKTIGLGSISYHFSPDPNQNLLRIEDFSGNITTYDYQTNDDSDPYNKPLKANLAHDSITNPNCYQAFNQVARVVVDPLGLNITETYRYSRQFNKLIRYIDPEGFKSHFQLDDKTGNRIKLIGPSRTITEYKYSNDGFINEEIDPDGRVTQFKRVFNPSNPQQFKQIISTVIGYKNDRKNLNLQTILSYDLIGNELSITDPLGHKVQSKFNELNQVIENVQPAIKDAINRQSQSSSQFFEYDILGNVRKTISHTNNIQTNTYDGLGRLTQSRIHMSDPKVKGVVKDDELDIISKKNYNYSGWIISDTDPNGHVFTYEYDNLGRKIRQISPVIKNNLSGDIKHIVKFEYGPNAGAGVFSYSNGWQPTSQINPRGYITHRQYDNNYRLIRQINRLKKQTAFESTLEPAPREPNSTYQYDKRGLLIKGVIANTDNNGEQHNTIGINIYNQQGRLTTVVKKKSNNPVVDTRFTTEQQLKSTLTDDDIVEKTAYDQSGNIIKEIDAHGSIVEHIYDGAKRKIKTLLPARNITDTASHHPSGKHQPVIDYSYDDNGNQIIISDENNTISFCKYNARNQVIESTIQMQNRASSDLKTSTIYDFDGRIKSVTDGRGGQMKYLYDRAGRETRSFAPDGQRNQNGKQQTTTQYDKNGNITRISYRGGKNIVNRYDVLNRVTEVNVTPKRGDTNANRSVYDENNNITAIIYSQNGTEVSIKRRYDAFDRLISEEMPDIGDNHQRKTLIDYHLNGQIAKKTTPKGDITEIQYDQFSRTTQIIYHDQAQQKSFNCRYQYNKLNQVTFIDDELSGQYQYTHDDIGQLVKTEFNDPQHDAYVLQFAYDARGNRTQVIYPDDSRTLSYQYDRNNRLSSINDNDKRTQYKYDANNNLIETHRPNGTTEQREYDLFNRLTLMHTIGNKTSLYRATYEYNKNGHCTGTVQNWHGRKPLSIQYQYDDKNRLTHELWNDQTSKAGYTYRYDNMGNRVSEKGLGTFAHIDNKYHYNLLNQLTRLESGDDVTDFSYDLNGNLLSEKNSQSSLKQYTWNCKNQLTACKIADNTIFKAKYSEQGFKYFTQDECTTKIDRWLDGTSIQERTTNKTTDFIYGIGLGGGIGGLLYSADNENTLTCHHSNLHGHSVLNTNLKGNLQDTMSYSAFGQMIHESENNGLNRKAFTKERIDVLALDYHGKRYYDPRTGRYISRDPLGFADSINNYLFVNNNPIHHIDQQGEWWDTIQFGLDILGAIPVIGSVASVVNAGISICRGDIQGALTNMAG